MIDWEIGHRYVLIVDTRLYCITSVLLECIVSLNNTAQGF